MTASMTVTSKNAVKFGTYVICREKAQLSYYNHGILFTVADVSNEFSSKDLYELASRIAKSHNLGKVEFVSKETVLRKR